MRGVISTKRGARSASRLVYPPDRTPLRVGEEPARTTGWTPTQRSHAGLAGPAGVGEAGKDDAAVAAAGAAAEFAGQSHQLCLGEMAGAEPLRRARPGRNRQQLV